ncbi:hypothetical protein, partial [Clostridium neonatale]
EGAYGRMFSFVFLK